MHGFKGRKYIKLKCPNCQKIFEREKRQTHLQKKSIATFCSKSVVVNLLEK